MDIIYFLLIAFLIGIFVSSVFFSFTGSCPTISSSTLRETVLGDIAKTVRQAVAEAAKEELLQLWQGKYITFHHYLELCGALETSKAGEIIEAINNFKAELAAEEAETVEEGNSDFFDSQFMAILKEEDAVEESKIETATFDSKEVVADDFSPLEVETIKEGELVTINFQGKDYTIDSSTGMMMFDETN